MSKQEANNICRHKRVASSCFSATTPPGKSNLLVLSNFQTDFLSYPLQLLTLLIQPSSNLAVLLSLGEWENSLVPASATAS